MVCQIENCERKVYAKQLCVRHWKKARRPIPAWAQARVCKTDGCESSFVPKFRREVFCSVECRNRYRRPIRAERLRLGICARSKELCPNRAVDGDTLCIDHRNMVDARKKDAQVKYEKTKARRIIDNSISLHLSNIRKGFSSYKDMPFCDAWNHKKQGSTRAGSAWILENLGPRPEGRWELHIVDRRIGFMPGNLQWVPKEKHKSEEMIAKLLLQVRCLQFENSQLKAALATQNEEAVLCG